MGNSVLALSVHSVLNVLSFECKFRECDVRGHVTGNVHRPSLACASDVVTPACDVRGRVTRTRAQAEVCCDVVGLGFGTVI